MSDSTQSERGPALDDRVDAARGRLMSNATWDGPEPARLVRRSQRRWVLNTFLVVLIAAAGFVWVARVGSDDPGRVDRAPQVSVPTTANADLLAPGTTRAMAQSPLSGRSAMATVWTGSEMIVWGGSSGSVPFGDGAAYDPRTDSWRTVADSPLSARQSASAVWTGTEMIVWGGRTDQAEADDGAAYDPASDTWRRITKAPIVSGGGPTAVWTGSEMIVLAGFNSSEAASYDPDSDEWRMIAPAPGRPVSAEPQAVWTGSELIAELGSPFQLSSVGFYSYDPSDDRWSALPAVGLGTDKAFSVLWDGDELLAIAAGQGAVTSAFDPSTGTWRPVATWPPTSFAGEAVWTGDAALTLGTPNEAMQLDPAGHTWTQTPQTDSHVRAEQAAVWADGVLLAWGGFPDQADGYLLRPAPITRTGSATPAPEAPPVALHEPQIIAVGAGAGVTAFVDLNGPPAEWNGTLLPVLEVRDQDGNLVGYFGCHFLSREEVETSSFEATDACPLLDGN